MKVRYRSCLMILADGARADVFQDLLQRGRLPEIGAALPTSRTAASAFPSTTGPAYLPYLTGCFPGTCNVPGIRWFDRESYSGRRFFLSDRRSYVGAETFLMNRDLDPARPTLFDLLKPSTNIFSTISRGAGWKGNRTKMIRIWYWYYAHLTDRWGMVDTAAATRTIEALKTGPRFHFVVFPAIDEFSHLASPFHPRALQAYEELDRSVGRIVRFLKKEGRWEETAFFIVSDHGLSETGSHFGLSRFIEEEMGLKSLYYPKVLFKTGFTAASMVSGNGMAHLYFKNGGGWGRRCSWEEMASRPDRLIERLLENPAVDLAAGRTGDGSVEVRSLRGEARIALQNGSLSYEVRGGDPFGFPPLPARAPEREYFSRTFETEYPDAPMQIAQIFRSRRTGDLVLSARKGYDLRRRWEVPEHKSSHGSLHWEHMKIPVLANAPLPEGPLRSADLFPAILRLLGEPIPGPVDGQAIL